jgi:hypothetical protein
MIKYYCFLVTLIIKAEEAISLFYSKVMYITCVLFIDSIESLKLYEQNIQNLTNLS